MRDAQNRSNSQFDGQSCFPPSVHSPIWQQKQGPRNMGAMPQIDPSSSSTVPVPRPRAPPPPPPVLTPNPHLFPDATPNLVRDEEMTEAPAAQFWSPEEPTIHKHRGLIRAIGGFFKRKCSDVDEATAPSDSEASQHRASRWSNWSQRQSLPERPSAAAEPGTVPIQKNETSSSSTYIWEPLAKKVRKEKGKVPFIKAKQSPTDPSELLRAESSDESEVEPSRVSFLFYGGSDVDNTFQPNLRPSELDKLHENEIRPSLQNKMPLFVPPTMAEPVRRSSILPDPKEYEL